MTSQTPVRATLESGDFDEDADVWTFHGTVIENDEETAGAGNPRLKQWPASELEQAAGQLEGKPVVDGHTYDENGKPPNDAVVGKVTDDWYDDETGWRYEMEVGEAELARKLHNGHLEVSFHGGGAKAGETDEGHAVMSNIYGKDLAIVPYGGARGNDVQPGAAPDTPASAAALSASHGDDSLLVELDGAGPDADGTADDTGNDTGGTPSGTQDNDMGDNTPDNDDSGLDLDGRVVIDEERHAELTAAENDLKDLQDEKEELEAELEAKDDQIDKVRGIYADRLAELSGFDAEFFEDKDLEDLETQLENQLEDADTDTDAVLAGTPMPQSGDGGDGNAPEENEEIAELREKKDACLERGMEGAAEHYDDQIEALTGGGN